MSDMSSDSDIENITIDCTPPEIKEEAQNVYDTLLPEKSKSIYMKVYTIFKNWCMIKKVTKISENVFLEYFQEQARNKKASSLWATFSMLKSTFLLKENIDISKYYELLTFLKRQNVTYKPKKSSAFSKEEIIKFLTEAPDEAFLSTKAIFVIGLAGACRTDELCNMHTKDIDIRDDIIIVNIQKSKNGFSRKFVLAEPLWVEIVKKYLYMRPTPDMLRVFISFRHGKPTRQNIGHNTISRVPKTVAIFLKLQNPQNYTGHSLRRTSATILVDNGGDILTLKRDGDWKSSTVVEDYVEESIADRKIIAGTEQGASTPPSNWPIVATAIPSTSSCFNPSPDIPLLSTVSEINNRTINIAMTNSNTNTSLNTGTAAINLTCNNCTINITNYNK